MSSKKSNLTPTEIPEIKDPPVIEDLLAEKQKLETEEAEKAKKTQEEADAKAKEPEIEVDLDAEREKTKQEVTDSINKDVIEPLKQEIVKLREIMNPEEQDDYDKFVNDFKTKNNGEVPQWKEVAEYLKNKAVEEVETRQKQAQEQQDKDKQESEKQTAATQEQNFKYWQSQLEEMEGKGLIPKMDKPEKGDKGFDARVQLYGHMANTWNKEGVTPITNLYEAHSKHYEEPTKQPAGGDAPVSIGQGSEGGGDDDKYDYNEIHQGSRNLDSFIYKQLQKLIGK